MPMSCPHCIELALGRGKRPGEISECEKQQALSDLVTEKNPRASKRAVLLESAFHRVCALGKRELVSVQSAALMEGQTC